MITLSKLQNCHKEFNIYNIYQFKETTLTRKEWAKLEILNPVKFKLYLHKLHYFRKYFILKFSSIILPRLILVKQVIFSIPSSLFGAKWDTNPNLSQRDSYTKK